jgi:hypothetical protein
MLVYQRVSTTKVPLRPYRTPTIDNDLNPDWKDWVCHANVMVIDPVGDPLGSFTRRLPWILFIYHILVGG